MIKNSRAAGNQSLAAVDSPLLTIPAAQPWAFFFTIRYDGVVTGDNPQYFISTGNFGDAGSLNITFYTLGATTSATHQGKILVFADTISSTANVALLSTTKVSTGEHQYVLQSDGTTVRLYRCPIIGGTVATEASVVMDGSSTSAFLLKELNGSTFMAGSRADGSATRKSDQSQSRTGFMLGNLTLAEIARMANGEDLVTNLSKTPVIYSRMSSVTDIADAGPNNFPFTLGGTPTTSAEPAYNFSGTPNSEPSNAITLAMPTTERIYQRVGGSAAVGLSGTIAGAVPAGIELQLYGADGSTVVSAWASTNASIDANTWTKSAAVPAGPGKRRAQVRSKNASGVQLAESAISTERFGVGDIQAWIGSSGAERGFTSQSATGQTPRDDVSYYDGTAWRAFGTVGAAIIAANAMAEKAGVPFGMIDSGQGGSTLANWITLSYAGWTAFVADAADVGGFTSCVITVGSNDASMGLVQSSAQHEANLDILIQRVREVAGNPNLWIILVGYNRRLDFSTGTQESFDAQSNMVRMAENRVGKKPFVIHVQTLDFLLSSDKIHLVATSSGYPALNVRSSFQAGSTIYDGVAMGSPYINRMVADGNDVLVYVTHRGSTDLNVPASATGFTGTGFDKQPITVLGVDRVSATLLRVRCDRPVETLQYLAGSAPPVGTPIYGNTAQPLPLLAETDMVVEPDTGVVPEPDTTAPVMSGAISITNVTTSGATLSYPMATDNVGVAGYEYSIDGGARYVNAGLSRSLAVSALTASTTYQVRARAYDDAGNRSAPLSASFTTLANEPPVEIVIDASKIPASRKVVFPGGTRVVPFGTKPSTVVPGAPYYRDGKWWSDKVPDDERYYVADFRIDIAEAGFAAAKAEVIVSGVKVLEQPVVQGSLIPVKLGGFDELRGALNFCTFRVTLANGEQIDRTLWFNKVDLQWVLEKDPEDKRYYVADVSKDLIDSNTTVTATAVSAVAVGVAELVKPQMQGRLAVIKLGGLDTSADPLNHCKLRFDCANGERFFRTIHFKRVDN